MKIVTFRRKNRETPKLVVDFPRGNTLRNELMEIVEYFDEKKKQQQRQTLEMVKDFACENKTLEIVQRFRIFSSSSFSFVLETFFIFFHFSTCFPHFLDFSQFFSFVSLFECFSFNFSSTFCFFFSNFFLFFCFSIYHFFIFVFFFYFRCPVVRADAKTHKKIVQKFLLQKRRCSLVKIRLLGLGGQGLGEVHLVVTSLSCFSFFFFLFSFFFFSIFSERKMFLRFHFSCISFKKVSLLPLVSDVNCRCFLLSGCSMEMWCPDDTGRD